VPRLSEFYGIVIFMFFRRFGEGADGSSYRRDSRMPDAEIVGNEEFPLTYGEVTSAFTRAEAPVEPAADRRP
jgi:hypothetical protein